MASVRWQLGFRTVKGFDETEVSRGTVGGPPPPLYVCTLPPPRLLFHPKLRGYEPVPTAHTSPACHRETWQRMCKLAHLARRRSRTDIALVTRDHPQLAIPSLLIGGWDKPMWNALLQKSTRSDRVVENPIQQVRGFVHDQLPARMSRQPTIRPAFPKQVAQEACSEP